MLPSNLKPSARLIAGADDTFHHQTPRPAEERRATAQMDTVNAMRTPDLFQANPRQGGSPTAGLPDMELWCNCDD